VRYLVFNFFKCDNSLQRLEFLGDAVLDYLIASYLFSAYPKLKPGQLTDLRSLSVNNKAFACVTVDRSFDKYLLCDSNGLSEAIKKYVDTFEVLQQRVALKKAQNVPRYIVQPLYKVTTPWCCCCYYYYTFTNFR